MNLPAIVVQGEWLEWTGGPVATAIDAAYEAMRGDLEIDVAGGDMDTPRFDATYYTGLLVGITLADSMRGAMAVRDGLRGRR